MEFRIQAETRKVKSPASYLAFLGTAAVALGMLSSCINPFIIIGTPALEEIPYSRKKAIVEDMVSNWCGEAPVQNVQFHLTNGTHITAFEADGVVSNFGVYYYIEPDYDNPHKTSSDQLLEGDEYSEVTTYGAMGTNDNGTPKRILILNYCNLESELRDTIETYLNTLQTDGFIP